MHPLRSMILAAAGSDALKRVITRAPVTRDVVRRFVAGESAGDALAAARRLVAAGALWWFPERRHRRHRPG